MKASNIRITLLTIGVGAAIAACSKPSEGNANGVVNAPAIASCPFPKLDFRAAGTLSAADRAKFTANFRAAVDKACAAGMFADRPLVDPDAYVKDTLFVMNAPEANVTSIYFGPSSAPPAMLLEAPFGDPPQIPSVEDLHESLYCAMVGATPEEEETTGRCLPD